MNENLIVEDNTIYEIDPECLKKKRKCQGETGAVCDSPFFTIRKYRAN